MTSEAEHPASSNPDGPEPIASVSWILELPRDLGLREDTSAAVMLPSGAPSGWEEVVDELPGRAEWELHGMPLRRIRFRRAKVGIGMPTEATDRAFGDLQQLSGLAKLRYALRLRRLSRRGVKEWKTVCEMTKWYVGAEIPDPPGPDSSHFEAELREGFDELLADLDLWLRAYGIKAGEFEVGSIALHDLPAAIPWLVEIRLPGERLALGSGLLPLHARTPDLLGAFGNAEAAREASITVGAPDHFPTFPALSTLFGAQLEARGGRSRQAVIDAGTAVEMMVFWLLGEVKRRRGESEAEIEQIEEQKWTKVFNRELPEALGVPIGATGAAHASWWRNAYQLRVRSVHKGYRPSQAQALRSVAETWDLFEYFGERLKAIPELEGLAAMIPVKRK
ncbi:MAG: hypothetical protein AB7F97_07515 [Solirubrobacterales bacterium]